MSRLTGKVDTATLIRGRTYTLRSIKFERGVPKVITDKAFLEILEDEVDEVPDGEGEVYEKPRFRIDRSVANPEAGGPTVKRLSATREVRKVRRIKRV